MNNKKMVWVMFFLLCVYNVIDTLQTIMLLELGAGEANPIYRFLIAQHGMGAIWVLKTAALAFLAFWIVVDTYQDRKAGRDQL